MLDLAHSACAPECPAPRPVFFFALCACEHLRTRTTHPSCYRPCLYAAHYMPPNAPLTTPPPPLACTLQLWQSAALGTMCWACILGLAGLRAATLGLDPVNGPGDIDGTEIALFLLPLVTALALKLQLDWARQDGAPGWLRRKLGLQRKPPARGTRPRRSSASSVAASVAGAGAGAVRGSHVGFPGPRIDQSPIG
jgi:hypothetical protein